MTSVATDERRPGSSLRLTLASKLCHNIDGAWWPRGAQIGRELPELVAVLAGRLGEITDIKLNWSSSVDPPKLDSYSCAHRHQAVMTISGHRGRANLLLVSHHTSPALAVLVLRRAAHLPIDPRHGDQRTLRAADRVVRAARAGVALTGLNGIKAGPPASRNAGFGAPTMP